MSERLEKSDLAEAYRLMNLFLPSLVLTERALSRLCRLLGRLDASMGGSPAFAERVGWIPDRLTAAIAANQYELRAQVLRSYRPRGWIPAGDVDGLAHLESALERGRGALLWVSHFVFHGLVLESLLNRAGYDLVHVSRREHGFSKTEFGMAYLNPIRTRVEDRFLKKRILLNDVSRPSLIKELLAHLRANDVVSITVGGWEGRQRMAVPLLGCRVDVATGASSAARAAGAALIPVFPVRDPVSGRFRVVLEQPIEAGAVKSTRAAREATAEAYGAVLEKYVLAYPDQWRGWKHLYDAPAAGAARA